MAIFKNTPPVVTDGLVYALDAANPFCALRAGIPQIIGISYSNVSNGTNTAVTTTLPDGTTGNCTKLAEGTYASGQTIMNEGYPCPFSSTFSMFVKPDGINFVKIRDGDTTNLQVDFNLTTGTIVGGNNTGNATIEAYPNGWFLISMTIFRGGSFSYGTRTVLSPDGTFTNHTSTPGAGIFMFQRKMQTVPPNITADISGNKFIGDVINGTGFNKDFGGSFIFDGVDDYILANNTTLAPYFSTTHVSHFTWIYPTSPGQIVVELGQTAINTGWHDTNIEISSEGIFRFSTWHGSLTNRVTSQQSFNKWYHVGFTYNGSILTAYVNGISVGTTSFTRQAPYNSGLQLHYGLFSIDSTNMGTLGYAGGKLASFFVYNKALTSQQVNQNYNALKRRFGL